MGGLTLRGRSEKLLRETGYTVDVCEFYDYHGGRRHDLFGIGDLIAVRDSETTLVQVTDITHVANRVTKIQASPHLDALRLAGWRVIVHGWRRDGRLREVEVA